MITLRPYQNEAIAAIDEFFMAKRGNPLVVAPTGSGKSLMIASYAARAISNHPHTRVMVLAHVQELIDQNERAFQMVSDIESGIYSAGLKRRDKFQPVIFASIQSVWDKFDQFGYIDFIVIDEAHLVNPKQMGRYRAFLDGLRLRNPKIKVIGFSATPFRLGHGWIHKGDQAVFDGIAYSIPIEELIKQGYLANPVARSGAVHADLSQVHTRGGEFVESEAAAEFDKITSAAVADIIARTPDRKCGLIFCTGLEHAAHTVAAFRALGEDSVDMVSGKTSAKQRGELVERVKNGQLRWLINVAVYTTGFDAPNIDVIGLLRATQSASLYIQMVGRGLRIADGKKDCLILDYGENVKRHGPLNFVYIREPGERAARDTIRAKDCPQCEQLIPVNARECPYCQFVFPVIPRPINHGTEAGDLEILERGDPMWRDVLSVNYVKHTPFGRTPSMRVVYRVGIADEISEWVCFDHGGYATQKAQAWAREHGAELMSVDEAIVYPWPTPKRIQIKRRDSKFFDVVGWEL